MGRTNFIVHRGRKILFMDFARMELDALADAITSAIVGVDGIKLVVHGAVLKATGRTNLHLKDNLKDAKDWLAAQ